MEGFEVITSDDAKVGHVVDVRGDNLIVEHGTIFKSRHALPKNFVDVDETEQVVRASVSKQILESSPKLDDGEVDERAVAQHYGLAEGFEAPPTEGYGETVPDDPAFGAERDRQSAGMTATEEERARIRSGTAAGEGPLDDISSPGITGGDRARDAGA
jgi:hypothetical protein